MQQLRGALWLQEHILALVKAALGEANITPAQLDCIAYTKVHWLRRLLRIMRKPPAFRRRHWHGCRLLQRTRYCAAARTCMCPVNACRTIAQWSMTRCLDTPTGS
jgi:hypothetical protein